MASVDLAGAVAKMRATRRGGTIAARRVLVAAADEVAKFMAVQPRQDTHRWSRAWIQAAHDVGAVSVPVPPITPSKYWWALYTAVRRYRDQMRATVQSLQLDIDVLFPKVPRNPTRGLYGIKMRRLEKAKLRLAKAQQMLEAMGNNPSAIVIHAGLGAAAGGGSGSRRPPQVVTTVYGGVGAIAVGQTGVIMRLDNREAHARIVASRYPIVGAVKVVLKPLLLAGKARRIVRESVQREVRSAR